MAHQFRSFARKSSSASNLRNGMDCSRLTRPVIAGGFSAAGLAGDGLSASVPVGEVRPADAKGLRYSLETLDPVGLRYSPETLAAGLRDSLEAFNPAVVAPGEVAEFKPPEARDCRFWSTNLVPTRASKILPMLMNNLINPTSASTRVMA